MNNQKGGIISNLFIIPAGVALMVGFFFLGYYVGRYQSKSGVQGEIMQPLPEVVSNKLPKQEEFTFYKTLTDKENKTVSIDLKPKSMTEEKQADKKDKKIEAKAEKEKALLPPKQPVIKQPSQPPVEAKKEPTSTHSPIPKLRYTIQIAAYQEKDMAEDDVKKMKTRGYAAFIVSSTMPDKVTWYRVRLGSFANKAAAEKLLKQLQAKEGISPFITLE
jgi:cell division septation protein DedD